MLESFQYCILRANLAQFSYVFWVKYGLRHGRKALLLMLYRLPYVAFGAFIQ